MINYKNSKIYKIVSENCEECYVGATTKKYLCQRLSQHVYDFRHRPGCSSKDILKSGKCKIILIENYPCSTRDELHNREYYWINKLNSVNKLNKNIV